jgi:hypothetical protein
MDSTVQDLHPGLCKDCTSTAQSLAQTVIERPEDPTYLGGLNSFQGVTFCPLQEFLDDKALNFNVFQSCFFLL